MEIIEGIDAFLTSENIDDIKTITGAVH